MERFVDFTSMQVGKVLNRWSGGQQVAVVCPRCGKVAKPKLAWADGTTYVHSVRYSAHGIHTVHCHVAG